MSNVARTKDSLVWVPFEVQQPLSPSDSLDYLHPVTRLELVLIKAAAGYQLLINLNGKALVAKVKFLEQFTHGSILGDMLFLSV